MNSSTPYLSVVVTARNDDHGGNLLRRMQAFVHGWISQCKRHDLSAELIVVEWNPPEDKPRLAEALRLPAGLGPCSVRFVEVPGEIHQRYRYADCLPLYQMIAKNAGIRRARGEFVLATNIDVLFSDELMQFFAARRLESGRMYRIDRHDVMSDVPECGTVDEQLAYCRSHLLRINTREGTYKLSDDGSRALEVNDIVIPGSGIRFGCGWFPVERSPSGEIFRWASSDAEVIAMLPSDTSPPLEFEIEPGPGVNYGHMRLQVLGEEGAVLAEAVVRRRSRLLLTFPHGLQTLCRFRLRVIGGGYPTPRDPRILNFRVYSCKWVTESASASPPRDYRLSVLPVQVASPRVLRQAVELCLHAGSASRAALVIPRYLLRSRKLKVKLAKGEDVFQRGSGIRPGLGWYPLEYCFGEGFRWVRKDAALIIHAPDGEPRKLLLQIEPGPGVNHAAFELLVRDATGALVTSAWVERGPQLLALNIPYYPGQTEQFVLTLDGGDRPARKDPRLLNFRISWCGWSLDRGAKEGEFEHVDEGNTDAPVFLHTNGCGDFTLMAREHWFDLRGYPEFDLFSMNIDSVLCYTAHHAGFREQVLDDPMRIYHIEHGTGSGWTPEGQTKLFTRLAEKGITFVDYQQVVSWAIDMRRMNRPMIFNIRNWGLASDELAEREVLSDSCARVSG
jgi:hypothetical protein